MLLNILTFSSQIVDYYRIFTKKNIVALEVAGFFKIDVLCSNFFQNKKNPSFVLSLRIQRSYQCNPLTKETSSSRPALQWLG